MIIFLPIYCVEKVFFATKNLHQLFLYPKSDKWNEMKWNEMKWNIFFIIKLTAVSGNTWKQNKGKLSNIHDKKNKKKPKL